MHHSVHLLTFTPWNMTSRNWIFWPIFWKFRKKYSQEIASSSVATCSRNLYWPFRVHILQPLVRYKRICIWSKKKLSEGSLGVYIFIYVSSRDYLERGVKTGICYPYTRVITCIGVTKIPIWPNLVVEYEVFLSWSPPILSDDSLSGLETSFWEWLALACQLRCKNE